MRVGIVGGTGFIGSHLTDRLSDTPTSVRLISRTAATSLPDEIEHRQTSITDRETLRAAVAECDAIVNLVGINYERGSQTYERVHVHGTRSLAKACLASAVDHLVHVSYLRARPGTGSGYLDSKWESEEIVRDASIPATIVKPPAVFGVGDQFTTHLARTIRTVPMAPTPGRSDRELRPIHVRDLCTGLARLIEQRPPETRTLSVMGPERLSVGRLVRRIAQAMDRRVFLVPTPILAMSVVATIAERITRPPLVTRAGVRMLSEGMTAAAPASVIDEDDAVVEPTRRPSIDRLRPICAGANRLGLQDVTRR